MFKNGPIKICGRQLLKNFTCFILEYYRPFDLLYQSGAVDLKMDKSDFNWKTSIKMMIFPLISKTVLKKIGTLVCSNSVFSRTERPWNSLLAGFFYSTYFLNGLKFRVVGKFYRCAFFFSLFSYYCNFMPHSSFPV